MIDVTRSLTLNCESSQSNVEIRVRITQDQSRRCTIHLRKKYSIYSYRTHMNYLSVICWDLQDTLSLKTSR